MKSSAVASLAFACLASAATVYTTEVVTAYTTYCPSATVITIGQETHTVTAATTLTISACPGGCTVTKPVVDSSSSAASPSATPTNACEIANNACRTAPGANQAQCSADYCTCLDAAGQLASGPAYCQLGSSTASIPVVASSTVSIPVVVSTTVVVPVASSSAPASCDDKMNACRTAPGANQATCSSDYCSCLSAAGMLASGPAYCQVGSTTASVPVVVSTTVVVPVATSSAPATCAAKMDACRTAPDANQAQCGAEYCDCLIAAGMLASGPAYCQVASATTSSTTSGSATGSAPIATATVVVPVTCASKMDTCRTAPGANQAQCSADYCTCLDAAGMLASGPSYCQVGTTTVSASASASGSASASASASATKTAPVMQSATTTGVVAFTGAAVKVAGAPVLAAAGILAMFL